MGDLSAQIVDKFINRMNHGITLHWKTDSEGRSFESRFRINRMTGKTFKRRKVKRLVQ